MDLNEIRRLSPCEHTYSSIVRKAFPFPGIHVTAIEHPFCTSLHESGNHFISETLRPCAGELDNAPSVVGIRDYTRQTIRLAMDKPHTAICRRKRRYPICGRTTFNGGGHERLHVFTAGDSIRRIRQHPNPDLALWRPASVTQNRTAICTHGNSRAYGRRPLHTFDCAREYPRMPAFNGTFASFSEKNLVHLNRLSKIRTGRSRVPKRHPHRCAGTQVKLTCLA